MGDVTGLEHVKRIAHAELPSRKFWARLLDHLSVWLVDHGFLRAFYSNRYRIAGNLYRSGQLSPRQVRYLSRDLGLRALINLRGYKRQGATLRLEAEASHKRRLPFFVIRSWSRGLLTREELLDIIAFIKTLELPALVHCKSGADRAGHFAVLYRHIRLGEPIERAMQELHWRYGHVAVAQTGILDHFFNTYLRERRPMQGFEDWVRHDYDMAAIYESFRPVGWVTWVVDHLLRRE